MHWAAATRCSARKKSKTDYDKEDNPHPFVLIHYSINYLIIQNIAKSKKVFLAILDWGLGHATRCIPIINELVKQGHQVTLGSSGNALQLLRSEYPSLEIIRLPSYGIRYPSKNMALNILIQLPKLVYTVSKELILIRKLNRVHHFDIIISDSRFGCFAPKPFTVFVAHQINIIVPSPISWLVNGLNHWIINRFSECWVPDTAPGTNSLSGKLATPQLNMNLKYIGPLSRMRPKTCPITYKVVAVLSGPEPQRSYLEQELLHQLTLMNEQCALVSGLPKSLDPVEKRKNLTLIPFLQADQLNELIASAEVVICRSGYSSVMDLATLGKKAILIPTPGQTEQEYLAQYFYRKQIYYYQNQGEIDLKKAFDQLNTFKGLQLKPGDGLKSAIKRIGEV